MDIKLDQIVVPEYRMRRVFDADRIQDLAKSIAQVGLQNPIVVRLQDGVYNLVSGERRFRALQFLHSAGVPFRHGTHRYVDGVIPATDFGSLDTLHALELELAENAIRVDLTWQEKSEAMSKLDALRKAQADAEGRKHFISDTAKEVFGEDVKGSKQQSVRDAVLLAKHLDDPDVRKAKTQKEAMKIVERKQRDILTTALAEKLQVSNTNSHVILHGSSLEILPTLPDGVFDIILTDPPYGIEANKMTTLSGSDSGTSHEYEDSFAYAAECVKLLAGHGLRISRASAHCYMFCDIAFWHSWRDIFIIAGWYVWPFPLIWDKGSTGMLLGACNGPRSTYEAILYAVKGEKPTTGVYPAVIQAASPRADLHAAQKPKDLLINLLRRSAVPGDRVLDPFCGSGGIFDACTDLQLTATGIEISPTYYAKAKLRLVGEAV